MAAVSKYAKINSKISKMRHKAGVRGISWSVDEYKLIKDLLNDPKCALTGWTLTEETGFQDTWSLDRIDSSRGYMDSNVQIVASSINTAKGELSQEDFIEMCKDVVLHAGYTVSKNEPLPQI
ncbi:hypothetical protein EBU71_13395 [bacterium]|nr:hypothetical protein [Candidatus Elulimicrobium humile]